MFYVWSNLLASQAFKVCSSPKWFGKVKVQPLLSGDILVCDIESVLMTFTKKIFFKMKIQNRFNNAIIFVS